MVDKSLLEQFDLQLNRYAPDIPPCTREFELIEGMPTTIPRAWPDQEIGVWFIDPTFCPASTFNLEVINEAQSCGWIMLLFNHELVFSKPHDMIERIRQVHQPTPEYNLTCEQPSPKEHEILSLIAGGFDTEQIMERLSISKHTVQGHITNITAKLGATNRPNAVAIALALGILNTDEVTWTINPLSFIIREESKQRRRAIHRRRYRKSIQQ